MGTGLKESGYQWPFHVLYEYQFNGFRNTAILISRWRVGGQSARYLIRDFLQEQPHSTPSDAWQRAVLLSGKRLLDPAGEPRLDSQMKMSAAAEHPFFWSGYLPMEGGL